MSDDGDQGATASSESRPGHTTSDSIVDSPGGSGPNSNAGSGNYSSLAVVLPVADPVLVQYDEKYMCPVHHGLIREPVQTSCGHRLCRACAESYLTDEPKPCPAQEEDCEDVTRNNIISDPGFKREINNLLVYCPNKPCAHKVRLRLLEKHISECDFRKVPCLYQDRGCVEVLWSKIVQSHQVVCPFRPLCCDLCGITYNASDKEDHDVNICPEATIKCIYKCGKTLKRRQLEEHVQTCPKKPSECPYKSLGCNFEGSKEEVKGHTKDIPAHFEVLIRFTVNTEEQRRQAYQAQQELGVAFQETARRMEALQAEIVKIHKELRLKMMQQMERLITVEQRMEQVGGAGEVSNPHHLTQSVEQLKSLIPQLALQDRQVAGHEIRMAEMDLRFQMLETASFDGTLLWKIRDFSHRKRDAVQGRTVSLYSQPFYAGRFGYKMCARVYLNGDGIGRGTHMSLYFVVMKGEYDALLPWPFQRKVSLILLDQSPARRHLKDEFFPDPNSTSFRRPENAEMNVASGCPLFVAHTVLDNPNTQYVKDDTLFIKVVVDIANLNPI